jgi:hypothetical protein
MVISHCHPKEDRIEDEEDAKLNALDRSDIRAREQELMDKETVLLEKAESIRVAKEKLESDRRSESDKRATE